MRHNRNPGLNFHVRGLDCIRKVTEHTKVSKTVLINLILNHSHNRKIDQKKKKEKTRRE